MDSSIAGNSQADKLAKIASSINIGTKIYPLQEDLLRQLHGDFTVELKQRWPYFELERTKQKYRVCESGNTLTMVCRL